MLTSQELIFVEHVDVVFRRKKWNFRYDIILRTLSGYETVVYSNLKDKESKELLKQTIQEILTLKATNNNTTKNTKEKDNPLLDNYLQ